MRPVLNTINVPTQSVDIWTQLERFLVLGTESGTYYTSGQKPTTENTLAVQACLRADGVRVVNKAIEISGAGRASTNTAALFTLALAASPAFAGAVANHAALAALPRVARTATHLCQFAAFVENLRGWGRGLRSAVANWYLQKPVKQLAHQMLKHRNRSGWSHADLLRMAHPKPAGAEQNALFQWAIEGKLGHLAPADLTTGNLRQLYAAEQVRETTDEHEVVRLIEEYGLTHEMIPADWKGSAAVWEALLHDMSYTAVLRHLGRMTQVGVIAPFGEATALAITRLTDSRRIQHARIHPIAVLSALQTYKQGRGARSSMEWTPVAAIVDALEEAFYLAFANVEPTGKRIYVAIEANGPNQETVCAGMPQVSTAMGAAALALTFARTEPNSMIAAFHDSVWFVDITKRDRLDRACAAIVREHRNSDPSLPVKDALKRGISVDAFILLTGSENWAGSDPLADALAEYRMQTGIPAKLVVVAMAANSVSTADPNDASYMDVIGFDASVPGVIADFIRN